MGRLGGDGDWGGWRLNQKINFDLKTLEAKKIAIEAGM